MSLNPKLVEASTETAATPPASKYVWRVMKETMSIRTASGKTFEVRKGQEFGIQGFFANETAMRPNFYLATDRTNLTKIIVCPLELTEQLFFASKAPDAVGPLRRLGRLRRLLSRIVEIQFEAAKDSQELLMLGRRLFVIMYAVEQARRWVFNSELALPHLDDRLYFQVFTHVVFGASVQRLSNSKFDAYRYCMLIPPKPHFANQHPLRQQWLLLILKLTNGMCGPKLFAPRTDGLRTVYDYLRTLVSYVYVISANKGYALREANKVRLLKDRIVQLINAS